MASETSAQWPVVAPGFMYIVKMGDYTHILQAADQKSSEHLNLAQVALRDINVARKLLEERGPFLLLDKQEKMEEMITDTESAINRVIGILKPARVEHISESSIRFNTQSPWALQDDPKSAATFGRLRLTHNVLKTVVHDLSNIESTVQLDNCDDRAESAVIPSSGQPPAPDAVQTSASKSANDLLTWKRSRRVNRHAQSNEVYSGDGLTNPELNGNDVFSPVSPEESRTTISVAHLNGRSHRDSISEDSNLQPESAIDRASDTSGDHLPVIHELEGGSSIIQLGPVRPPNAEPDDLKYSTPEGKSKALDNAEPQRDLITSDKQADLVARISHRRRPSSPPALRVTPPTLKYNNRIKRETWEEVRQRTEVDRPPLESLSNNPVQLTSQSMREELLNSHQNTASNMIHRPGRFHSLKARLRFDPNNDVTKSSNNGFALEGPAHAQNEPSVSRPPLSVFEETHDGSTHLNNELARNARRLGGENEPSIKSATYPPVRTQLLAPADFGPLLNGTSDPSSHILSPSRVQLSPLEHMQSPDVPETDETSPLSPHERVHEIFQIDPELTRLPSLLKAARSRRQAEPPFVSKQDSGNAHELHLPGTGMLTSTREPPDRSVTAPPTSRMGLQESRSTSHRVPSREDLTHLRSMSDTAVPQVSSARGPIPPRKPLPYRSSPLPSREPSPHVVSRIATPVLERRQSESAQPPSEIPQSSKAASGPPSPIQPDHPRNMTLQVPEVPSTQNLVVQATSSTSQNTSRKSSISAEGALNGEHSSLIRLEKTNGLAMNPPEIPDRQTSAYQAQNLAEIKRGKQVAQDVAQTPDYRSPAWQHSRQFFNPAHNVSLEQGAASSTVAPSRFRDQDQTKAGLMYAARNKALPDPGITSQKEANHIEEPRRVSEQATTPSATPFPPSSIAPQPPQQSQPPVETQQPQLTLPEQEQEHEQEQRPVIEAPPRPSPSPKPSEHTKSSFLQHQAAKLHARQQSNPAPVLPPAPAMGFQQVRPPQPGQAVPLRLILPPRAPPAMSDVPPARPTKRGKQTVPQSAHREVSTASSTGNPPVNDQQPLKQRLFRPSMDKHLTPPKEVSRETSRATSTDGIAQSDQGTQQQQIQLQVDPQAPLTPQQRPQQAELRSESRLGQQQRQKPHHHLHLPDSPVHERNCDDDKSDVKLPTTSAQVASPPVASEPPSSESLQDLIKMNNQLAGNVPLAQNVPRIPAPIRNEDYLNKPAPTVVSTQVAPAATVGRNSKKKSWLVHQAGKIAGKAGI